MRYIIGLDPGEKGGIAVLDKEGDVVEVSKMPITMLDILSFLRNYPSDECVAYLENVGHGMPGQSSAATARFARHNGHLEMALQAVGIKTNMVTPQKWEKSYQLGKSSDYSKTEWKNRLKSKAQQLFPNLGKKLNLATCDAILLAEYGRKQEIGK